MSIINSVFFAMQPKTKMMAQPYPALHKRRFELSRLLNLVVMGFAFEGLMVIKNIFETIGSC
jgi:hypothetical protein